jgi:hypothetical protein
MAIFVDDPLWWRHERHWCHMVSNESYDELHEFAGTLGVPERGFHRDHYDIPVHVREAAIGLGALAVSSRELVRLLREAGLRASTRAVPRTQPIIVTCVGVSPRDRANP